MWPMMNWYPDLEMHMDITVRQDLGKEMYSDPTYTPQQLLREGAVLVRTGGQRRQPMSYHKADIEALLGPDLPHTTAEKDWIRKVLTDQPE